MGLNVENSKPQSQGNQTQGQQRPAQQAQSFGNSYAQTQAGTQQPRKTSLASLLTGGRANLSIVRTSGDLLRLQSRFENFIKAIDEKKSDFEYQLLALDMQTDPTLSVSVLVWMQHQRGQFHRVAYRSFVIASSLGELAPRVENFQGLGQLELLRVPCQAYDERMANIVRQRVAQAFPGKQLLDCDYFTVPVDFNYDEVEEDRRGQDVDYVYNLASWTDNNLVQTLDRGTEFYNVVDLSQVERDNNLQVKPWFGDTDVTSVSSITVRGSVQVSLTSVYGGQNNEAVREDELTRAIGYMDVAWVGRPQMTNSYGGMNQQPVQPWLPHFIMTDFVTGDSQNIETYDLALVAAHVLRQNYAWMHAFRTRDRAKINIHDIGSLSVLANPTNDPSGFGKIEDTRAADFNQDVYIESMIRPDLIMSVDIPVGRTLASFMTLIGDAAAGVPKAKDILIDSLNQLTGGLYGTKCNELNISKDLFFDSGIVLPEGYYIDDDGSRRDLRNIDVIAYSNFVGNKDNGMLIKFVNCLQQTNMQPAERLALLRKHFVGVLGETNVKFTGITRRLNINAKAMAVLAECVGLLTGGIRPVLPQVDQTLNLMQGMSGLDMLTLQGNIGNGMFNNNPMNNVSNVFNNVGHVNASGRWG